MIFDRNAVVLGAGRISSAMSDSDGNIRIFADVGGGIEERVLAKAKRHIRTKRRIVSYADDVVANNDGTYEIRGGVIVFRSN